MVLVLSALLCLWLANFYHDVNFCLLQHLSGAYMCVFCNNFCIRHLSSLTCAVSEESYYIISSHLGLI